jgi:ribonucleoside-diphosphate reductase alpha chain
MKKLTTNACQVLEARYLLRDEEGAARETPGELFARVAGAVAAAEGRWDNAATERWRTEFLRVMEELLFLPNSPTLMNAGTDLGQLSACFVLPSGDSREEIFDALRSMALVQRTGGGTGFAFSRLRPRGSRLGRTGGRSCSGPVSCEPDECRL